MLGGHVDSYHMDYITFTAGEPDASVFEPSSVSGIESLDDCIPQPAFDDDDGSGPTLNSPHGPTHHTPKNDMGMLHPEGASSRHSEAVEYFAEHGKEYKDDNEHEARKALYHGANRYINAVNRQKNSYVLGLNHMADWSTDEKKGIRGRLQTSAEDLEEMEFKAEYTHKVDASNPPPPPKGVDWRGTGLVTPVKDQGTCGSCWSYGTTGSIEGQVFKKTGKSVDISQQNLMDCSWPEGNNACDGGLDYNAYKWIVKHGGIATSKTYGDYMNADGFCHFTDPDVVVGAKLKGYVNVTEGDVEALNDALVNVGPISVSIDASPDSFYYYKGGYYDNKECKNGVDDLDHTVLAVGFTIDPETGKRYSIVKNSWSTYWGDQGYVYVAQEGNICGVATTPTYPILE